MIQNLKTSALMLGFAAAAALGLAAPAFSSTLGGDLVVAETGDVTATFISQSAGYTSLLYLDQTSGDVFVFNNHVNQPGDTFNLGSFDAGTELTFYILVNDTGDVFYTGDGSLNLDGLAHATVETVAGITYVGFEDLFGGGDQDYNDVYFSFTNTKIAVAPLPAGGLLLLGGLGALAAAKRRKAAKAV
jgi:Domain of unknown function (DUF4114)